MTLKLRFDSMQRCTMKTQHSFLNIETIDGDFQLVISETFKLDSYEIYTGENIKHATI